MKKKFLIVLLALLMNSICTWASDVMTLANGMAFSGEVVRVRKCELVFKSDNGGRFVVPAADIATVQFSDPFSPVYVKYLSSIDADDNACMKGASDAKAFHGQTGAHVALGILLGPLGVVAAAVSNPQPSGGARTSEMSKNASLFSDPQYLECYKKAARSKNVGSTAAGWGMWILLFLMF